MENNFQGKGALPESSVNIWDALGSDLKSPLYRIHRLNSFLCTLYTALDYERNESLPTITIQHFSEVAEFCYQESVAIDGDLERWLTGTLEKPRPAAFRAFWDAISLSDYGPLEQIRSLQSLLCTLHTALEKELHEPLNSLTIQHLASMSKFCWKHGEDIDTQLKEIAE